VFSLAAKRCEKHPLVPLEAKNFRFCCASFRLEAKRSAHPLENISMQGPEYALSRIAMNMQIEQDSYSTWAQM
jgi:hypothetical protein